MNARLAQVITILDNEYEWTRNLYHARRDFLTRHLEVLDALVEDIGVAPNLSGRNLDFDNLPHEKVVKVMLAFPGVWTKEYDSVSLRVDYVLKPEPASLGVRCYQGEPPPTCKIVEEKVLVPAIPEHFVMMKRLECND